jgi:hypothetical protein
VGSAVYEDADEVELREYVAKQREEVDFPLDVDLLNSWEERSGEGEVGSGGERAGTTSFGMGEGEDFVGEVEDGDDQEGNWRGWGADDREEEEEGMGAWLGEEGMDEGNDRLADEECDRWADQVCDRWADEQCDRWADEICDKWADEQCDKWADEACDRWADKWADEQCDRWAGEQCDKWADEACDRIADEMLKEMNAEMDDQRENPLSEFAAEQPDDLMKHPSADTEAGPPPQATADIKLEIVQDSVPNATVEAEAEMVETGTTMENGRTVDSKSIREIPPASGTPFPMVDDKTYQANDESVVHQSSPEYDPKTPISQERKTADESTIQEPRIELNSDGLPALHSCHRCKHIVIDARILETDFEQRIKVANSRRQFDHAAEEGCVLLTWLRWLLYERIANPPSARSDIFLVFESAKDSGSILSAISIEFVDWGANERGVKGKGTFRPLYFVAEQGMSRPREGFIADVNSL